VGTPLEILLLVGEETPPGSLVRASAGMGARVRVRRWARVTGLDLGRRGLQAVVFESNENAGERRRREALLRCVPEGVARVSLVPKGRQTPPRRGRLAADLHLVAPVDLRVLTDLISLGRRYREVEERYRRARRVAGQLSRQLKILGEVTRASSSEFDPRRIMDFALGKMRLICPVSFWSVLLVDEEKSCLTFYSCSGGEIGSLVGSRLGMGEGIAGRVLRSRAPLVISQPQNGSPSLSVPEVPAGLCWSHILCLPLLSRGKAIGVVELIQGQEKKAFRRRDLRALSLLVEPMAIAVENALLLRKSEELSITDDLTKLYNSRYLNSYLLREVQRSRRYGAQVSLIFLDLDGFKNINDCHGHLAGSRALVEVGAVIRNMVREIDVVSRFGGDEFTVILPQTGPEGARIIAERMRCRVQETVFLEAFALEVRITASFGIACFPDHADSKDALIQKADQAMYWVKGAGKNGVELAEPSSFDKKAART